MRLPIGANEFAHGVTDYSDTYLDDRSTRIVLLAQFANASTLIPVIVDTGAPWCILSPNLAEDLGIDYQEGDWQQRGMQIRGFRYSGWLCNAHISLEATEGTGITIDATIFVPQLDPNEPWNLPNFIGLSGFLERIRFAVDPEDNLFYFGAFGDL